MELFDPVVTPSRPHELHQNIDTFNRQFVASDGIGMSGMSRALGSTSTALLRYKAQKYSIGVVCGFQATLKN